MRSMPRDEQWATPRAATSWPGHTMLAAPLWRIVVLEPCGLWFGYAGRVLKTFRGSPCCVTSGAHHTSTQASERRRAALFMIAHRLCGCGRGCSCGLDPTVLLYSLTPHISRGVLETRWRGVERTSRRTRMPLWVPLGLTAAGRQARLGSR